jgi:peptide/nickel transport system permease protein
MLAFWRRFLELPSAVFGMVVVILAVLMAVGAAYIVPYDPNSFSPDVVQAPSLAHWMGTDHQGRDVLSRVIYGIQAAMLVGLLSSGIAAAVGIVFGAVSGYFGGWIDDLLSRITDIFLLIPVFFLLIVTSALFQSNLFIIMVAIGLTNWPYNARIMRSQVLSLRRRPFVLAAVAAGASPTRILWSHIVPNGISPVISNTGLRIAAAIMTEAGLSFLGLGDPNVITWGQMIQTSQRYLSSGWWAAVFPGLALVLLVCAFNFIGDGMEHALNPRARREAGK